MANPKETSDMGDGRFLETDREQTDEDLGLMAVAAQEHDGAARVIQLFDAEGEPDPEVEVTVMSVLGHEVKVYVAPAGTVIDPRGPGGYTEAQGPNTYTHFIEMGDLLNAFPMSGEKIEPAHQWKRGQIPDEFRDHIGMVASYDHGPDALSDQDRTLAEIALNGIESFDEIYGLNGYLDPVLCNLYRDNERVVGKYWQKSLDVTEMAGFGLVRAGEVALDAIDVPKDHQILSAAKRHNYLKDRNRIGIGMSIGAAEIKQLQQLDQMVIAERAIASGSSIIAALLVLRANQALPNNIVITGTGVSQRSAELLSRFFTEQAEQGAVETFKLHIGRLVYHLSGGEHPYYLVSKRGNFSVLDGGDWGDIFNSPEHRAVWPATLTQEHYDIFKAECPEIVEGLVVGQTLTFEVILEMRNRAVDHKAGRPNLARWYVGEVLTGVEYTNTNG